LRQSIVTAKRKRHEFFFFTSGFLITNPETRLEKLYFREHLPACS
jgi:hypothetical protein